MSAVSRLRGSQLKNHVDSIIGRYSQHHWYLLSKEEDQSQTPKHTLPKSVTTRSKHKRDIKSSSTPTNVSDTYVDEYVESLIADSYNSCNSPIVDYQANANIDLTDYTNHNIDNNIGNNTDNNTNNIDLTDYHNTNTSSNGTVEVFDLSDSPDVSRLSMRSTTTPTITTIDLISSMTALDINDNNDTNDNNDDDKSINDHSLLCIPCDTNNNNKGHVTKSNNIYGDDDELWDSDYDTKASKPKAKASSSHLRRSSYSDNEELWNDNRKQPEQKTSTYHYKDDDDDDDEEWDGNAILTYEPPPKLYNTKNNNSKKVVINDDDDDNWINDDSDNYSDDADFVDSDDDEKSVDENTNTNTKSTRVIPINRRKQMSTEMFTKFNKTGFGSQLPSDMSVQWSSRLLTTAGITKMKTVNGIRQASIELSVKVVDDEERLRNTLLHEMCHAASWIVDGEKKPPHGKNFWKWASTCENKINGAKITTCHAYEIFKPFKYECTNNDCKTMYARHSKNSIDINKHRCGKCRSRLNYLGNFNQNGTPKKARQPTGFSLFVKEHYQAVVKNRRKSQSKKASDIMLVLSQMYKQKQSKDSTNDSDINEIL